MTWARAALRRLNRQRTTSVLAVLALGLGLGVNTALFSALDAALFRALPFASPDRVVSLRLQLPSEGGAPRSVAGGDVVDWAELPAFSQVAAWWQGSVTLGTGTSAERVDALHASRTLFRVFPARFALGRGFDVGAPPSLREAVLSSALWHRRFGGDPSVLGRTVRLSGEEVQIVGVLAPGFDVFAEAELWITSRWDVPEHPIRPTRDPRLLRDSHWLQVAARLAPGATLASARAELDAWAPRRAAAFPDADAPDMRVQVRPFREALVGQVRPTLHLLWAAGAFTLLLACANVAALLVAQGLRRRPELEIRRALGASRRSLVALFLGESVLLSLAGAVLGGVLAAVLWPLLSALLPAGGGRGALRPSLLLLGVTVGLTALTAVLTSIAPALLARPSPRGGPAMQATQAPGATLWRDALVVAQVSVALVLLTTAGLLVRSLRELEVTPLGFEVERVATAELGLPQGRYPDASSHRVFARRLLETLRAEPAVRSAALASRVPLSGANAQRSLSMPGGPDVDVGYRLVTAGALELLGIPLRSGRTLGAADEDSGASVAVVNEAFARTLLPGVDPVGRAVSFSTRTVTIVGVVGDVRFASRAEAPLPEIYLPLGTEEWPLLNVLVRGPAPLAELDGAVRRAVARTDGELAPSRIRTLSELAEANVAGRRVAERLLSSLAALTLVLAVTGIAGVLSHAVAQRRRELGIRMALGATPGRVWRALLLRASAPVVLGLALGIGGALVTGRLVRTLLYGVRPGDVTTLGVAVLGLGLVTLLANAAAARRVTEIDPAVALRSE